MNNHDTIRREVEERYAKAVSGNSASPGCNPGAADAGGCCSAATPIDSEFLSAGYDAEVLGALPEGAVAFSFGCGDPLALAEVADGDVVVDLGSGAGTDILIAARKVGPSGHVIGIDMTGEMIAKARKNIAAAGLENVEVRKGIVEDLPVQSDSADWVISNCVINLSPDKPRVFAEIARVLKPGGRMAVSDIVIEELPQWARLDKALYGSCVAGAISEGEYVEGLKKAGLVDVEVTARLVYDRSQVEGLVRSKVSEPEGRFGGRSLAEVAESLAGKI